MDDIASIETIAGVISLAVCLVIVTLFVGELVAFNVAVVVAVLFVAAMVFIISGLVLFLREVGIATGRMRIGMEAALSSTSPAAIVSGHTPPGSGSRL